MRPREQKRGTTNNTNNTNRKRRRELRGRTPLLCALDQDLDTAAPRLVRTCEALHQAGADPKRADKSGELPERIAGQWAGLRAPIFERLAGKPKGKKKRG